MFGRMPSDERRAHHRQEHDEAASAMLDTLPMIFDAIDLDGDGKITTEELKQAATGQYKKMLKQILNPSGKAWQEVMARCDENSDGIMDEKEFIEAASRFVYEKYPMAAPEGYLDHQESPQDSPAADMVAQMRAARGETSHESAAASRDVSTRVAVYGGSMDPITNDHLRVASEIARCTEIDEVWIVPCGPRPDKPSLKTSSFDRYCMCEVAVNTTFSPTYPVKVDSSEIFDEDGSMRPETMATYDLLTHFRARHPDKSFTMVVGSDLLQPGTDLRTWDSADPANPGRRIPTGHLLVQEFDFLVMKRPGYEVPDLGVFGARFRWLEMPFSFNLVEGNISSSEIRKRSHQLQRTRSGNHLDESNPLGRLYHIDGLVAPGVLAYIHRHGLYQG